MTSFDSRESFSDGAKQTFKKHRAAARAMVALIVLREDRDHRVPNFDDESHENWVRSQVFRLQHESLQYDPTGEFDGRDELSLAETMANSRLNELAQPGRPLTRERLLQLDPELLPIAEQAEAEGLGWPTDDTVFHDVIPEDYDDYAFGRRLVEGGRAYNNFPALLSAFPGVPKKDEDALTFMARTKWYQYATKPYLIRAHMIQPEFMGVLQRSMDEIGSSRDWQERLFRAVTEESPDPDDQILLRASRLSYQLLINLMRSDDLHTQARLLELSTKQDITDAVEELWT